MNERRTAPRYDLLLPVSVRVPDEKESASWTGRTRDISVQGVYFTTDHEPNTGAELDLTMTLPTEVTGRSEVFIRAIGKVLRVEKRFGNGDQSVGVAVAFEVHEIVRNEADVT
jgi:hypothetical protein